MQYTHLLTMLARLKLEASYMYGAAYKLCRHKQVIPLTLWFATHAGAEKITTVQEAADLISQQIK